MKKLFFSALFSLLFMSTNLATILPLLKDCPVTLLSEEGAANIQITFKSNTSLQDLVLQNNQHILFSDGNGGSQLVGLTVNYSLYVGGTLHVDFSTNYNVANWFAVTNQQLDFIHASTGAASTVDFIIIDQIIQ